MKVKVQEINGQYLLPIPPEIAEAASIRSGVNVEVSVCAGAIVVRRPTTPQYSLATLLAQVTADNRPAEVDWGPPVGKEVW